MLRTMVLLAEQNLFQTTLQTNSPRSKSNESTITRVTTHTHKCHQPCIIL